MDYERAKWFTYDRTVNKINTTRQSGQRVYVACWNESGNLVGKSQFLVRVIIGADLPKPRDWSDLTYLSLEWVSYYSIVLLISIRISGLANDLVCSRTIHYVDILGQTQWTRKSKDRLRHLSLIKSLAPYSFYIDPFAKKSFTGRIHTLYRSLGTAKRSAGGEPFIPQCRPRAEENGKLLLP